MSTSFREGCGEGMRGWGLLMLAAYCFRGGEAVVGSPQTEKVAFDFRILGNPPTSTIVYGATTIVHEALS
jgi:hypothetical protein